MANTQILLRRDTAANWASVNPILGPGELAIEQDTQLFKFGDGVTRYNSLPRPAVYATPTAASALTGTSLPLNIVSSSLTTVGTLSSLTVNGAMTVTSPNVISGKISNATFADSAGTASTAGSATTATTASTVAGPIGGTDNAIVFLKANNTLGFIPNPGAATGVFLEWTGSAFSWANSPAPSASTISGTTLNSTIVNSSLTAVGTIATGVWNGTPISISYGGTGATSASAALTALGAAPAAGSTSITTIGTLSSLTISGTTDGSYSNSTGFGTITTQGGVYMAKGAYVGTTITVAGTTASTSSITGALTVAGGVGVAGNVNVAGNLYVGGSSIKSLALAFAAAMS